jgi:hypothetical protein
MIKDLIHYLFCVTIAVALYFHLATSTVAEVI